MSPFSGRQLYDLRMKSSVLTIIPVIKHSTGFFVCKLKKLSNDKNVGAVAQEESDEEDLDVNEADFKSHVLENVQIPKEARKKKGKGKVGTAPEPVEANTAPADKAEKAVKVKKPSKMYLQAMAELEAERKTKQKKETEKRPKGKNEKPKKSTKTRTKAKP